MPSKRDREIAKRKREVIMASRGFQEWYQARKTTGKMPSDPYQAYMTDKALKAKPADRFEWERKANRRDYGLYDYPFGEKAPSPKPKQIPRKNKPQKGTSVPSHWTKVGKYQEPTKIENELKSMAEQMSMEHTTAPPEHYQFKRNRGAYAGQMAMKRHRISGRIVGGEARLGTKGSEVQVKTAASHEIGHWIHATAEKKRLAASGVTSEFRGDYKGLPKYAQMQLRYREEKVAWKIGETGWKKFSQTEKRQAKWFKRVALESYRTPKDVTQKTTKKGREEHWKWGRRIF